MHQRGSDHLDSLPLVSEERAHPTDVDGDSDDDDDGGDDVLLRQPLEHSQE